MPGEMGPEEFDALLVRAQRHILREVNALRCKSAERNFEIKLSHEYGLDIILCKKNGQEFQLSTLLPAGARFKKGKLFEYDLDEKTVSLKTSERYKRHFLPVALHEIGHANEPALFSLCRKYEHTKARTKNFFRGVREFSTAPNLSMTREIFSLDEQAMYEILCAKHRYMAKSERDAWRYSFTQLRDLDKRGYNVYADLNRKKMLRLAKYALRSHELSEFAVRSEFEWPEIDLDPYFVNKPLFGIQ
jgi:hypothetical protein